jgi:hypothetical protein
MKLTVLIAACTMLTACQHIGPGSYSSMYPPGSPCLPCGQTMMDQYQPTGERVLKRERQWNDPR